MGQSGASARVSDADRRPGSGADDAVKSIVEAGRPGRVACWLDARLYRDRDSLPDAITQRILD